MDNVCKAIHIEHKCPIHYAQCRLPNVHKGVAPKLTLGPNKKIGERNKKIRNMVKFDWNFPQFYFIFLLYFHTANSVTRSVIQSQKCPVLFFFKLMHTLAVPGFVMLLFVYIRYTCSRMHLYPENGERVDYLGVPHANRVDKFWGVGASAPPSKHLMQ